jgi:hypothetical protein
MLAVLTEGQRATLDAARKQNVRVEIGNEDNDRAPTPASTAPTPQTVRLNDQVT